MIDYSKYVMSKYVTKEELLEDKCEALKKELEIANNLLTKAGRYLSIICKNCVVPDNIIEVKEKINNYLNKNE